MEQEARKDREQVRRDAEQCADDPKVSATASAWAHKWLVLDAELQQVERDGDGMKALLVSLGYTADDWAQE